MALNRGRSALVQARKTKLNAIKDGPLRLEHGRYINFISDFMKANPRAPIDEAIAAWNALKDMDVPKTYQAWLAASKA